MPRAWTVIERPASELQRLAHPRKYRLRIRCSERPGLELQGDDAGVVAVREGGEKRPKGEAPLAGEAVLVAARQIRVGEVDVAQLSGKQRVRFHQVHLARPDVAGVERNVAQIQKVLGQVAAPWFSQEGAGTRHVLDGDGDALIPSLP